MDAQHHNHAQEISTNDRSDGEYRGGRSGSCGHGRGRGNGRGHRNQHQSGTATRAFPNPELHMAKHDEEEEESNINSDNQQNHTHITTCSAYPSHTVTLLHVESYIQHHHIQPNRSLFLDSCSSTNLVSMPSLLHNIHEVKTTLHVCCNVGSCLQTKWDTWEHTLNRYGTIQEGWPTFYPRIMLHNTSD